MASGDPPDPEFHISPAGKGWLRYFGLAVDEPLAVGAPGLTYAQRMNRALDILGNRQFLDRVFNSGTKGNLEPGPGPRPSPLPEVSVVNQPSAIWRPTLENVIEWRELASFISNKTFPRVRNETSPGKIKKIINEAIRNELKWPTTDAGRKLNKALESETGMKAEDLFRPVTYGRQPWKRGNPAPLPPQGDQKREAMVNGGVVIAGVIKSAAESTSEEVAHTQAKADLDARLGEIEQHLADNPDQGVLIVQVFEVRQIVEEAAPITTYRYTTVTYGRKEHQALWRLQDQGGISAATDAFSTEYREVIWTDPPNEREPDPGPIPGPPSL
jgi:hypothetical protein